MRERDQHNVKDSVKAQYRNKKKNCTYLLANVFHVKWEHLKSMFANMISDTRVIFLVDSPEKIPMVIFFVEKILDLLICTETKDWYDSKNDYKQRVQFHFFLINRVNHFMCMVNTAGNDYSNFEVIKNKEPANLSSRDFQKSSKYMARSINKIVD